MISSLEKPNAVSALSFIGTDCNTFVFHAVKKLILKMASCPKINARLLPMKVVMFGWFGANACAIPFMSIHMKELGLTVKETAVIYTLLPITQMLSSPIAGLIADRLGKYRDVLLVSILMCVVLATALLYVPTIAENAESTSSEFALINFCGGKHMFIKQCNNYNETNRLLLHSCQLKCNGSSVVNTTWTVALQMHKTNVSNICEYKISDIHQGNETLEFLCNSVPQNYLSNCSITCIDRTNCTSSVSSSSSSGRYFTFYLYSVLRVVHNIFNAIGYTLVNSSAIALTETDTSMGEYGRQRFWAILAMGIFPPLAGVLVDIFNASGDLINYAPAFHTHNILAILTGIAVWYLDFELEDAPSSYMETLKNFWHLIRNPTIFFLLILVFWLGTMWGFLESFMFWFLIELGSPTYLLGLTVTIGSIVGLPFLHYARLIVTKLGYANILTIAVIMYMIRCIGLSYLLDPWWIMPFETLEIFTFHLMWVAAATYAAHLSPPGLLATVQGFIEGVHYGVGQGSGSLIGGVLMGDLGPRSAFRVMGIISGIVGIIYFALHYLWLRKCVVRPPSRRASIKSFSSHRQDRKESTLSSAEANGIPLPPMEQTSINLEIDI